VPYIVHYITPAILQDGFYLYSKQHQAGSTAPQQNLANNVDTFFRDSVAFS